MDERASDREGSVPIHGEAAFAAMREAGRLAAMTLDDVTPHVVPGATTAALDRRIDAFMRDHGGVPATLGYKGYPASSCISINHVVNHGIPPRASGWRRATSSTST